MIAVLLPVLAQTAMPAPACTQALCDADRLRPYLSKLAAARDGRTTVRIVQIGDSHTAGDQLTGSWRTALQTRYGSAGRGMLAPGRPYAGYLTRGIGASQSEGWRVDATFGPARSAASTVALGLSGYAMTAPAAGAWMALNAEPVERFDSFTVCGRRAPGAGTVRLTVGYTSIDWSLAGPSGPACRTVKASAATTLARVEVVAGSVTLTSWTTEMDGQGGVSLSNLGIVGSQFVHLERADEAVMAAELAAARPDLIVVAFGTNEAFKPNFSATDYDASLQAGLRRLQRLAPGVPILMLGAPDAATSRPELKAGSVCPVGGQDWAPPAALATVRAIQRQRAHELGIAFWDWNGRMGGPCTADVWARATPPLMRGDHVHFTRPGADRIAGMLQADLDTAVAGLTGAASDGD